jgi:putative transposase
MLAQVISAPLKRFYGLQHLHYITCSCYHRQPLLGPNRRKDRFLSILEQVRQRYQFLIVGYVVMPEHIHLLLGEPKRRDLSVVMQVLKQRVSRQVRQRRRRKQATSQLELWSKRPPAMPHFWQPRFYDFNVFTQHKLVEKLRYIHRNPVTRGLVELPEQWRWSSYRFYAYGEKGPVKIGYDPTLEDVAPKKD